MEADPSIEFDHFLAERLSKTVAEIRSMDNQEYMDWSVYYGRKAQRRELEEAKARARR